MNQNKHYIIPFSDLVAYLESTIGDWPSGHIIPLSKKGAKERHRLLTTAAGIMAETYINDLSDPGKDIDLYAVCLTALGYDISRLDAVQWTEADEYLQTYFILLDAILGPLLPSIRTNLFTIKVSNGELVLCDQGNRFRHKYLELLEKLKLYGPPKQVTELDDLEEVEDYLGRVAHTLLSDAPEAVRDEIKRLAIEAISRY